ncbi:MAG: hypothetical protein KIT25_11925 [Enhydrobacter sp.]|nr:MAG: hypothetical protein KIT25_11925 [Enhydrobacter sp.]
MPQVRCTSEAVEAIKALSPRAYAEITLGLDGVRSYGLKGERHFAVLDHRWDVYLLEADFPDLAAILVVDPANANVIVVADVGAYSTASEETKKFAAMKAAAAVLSKAPTDIHIVRGRE